MSKTRIGLVIGRFQPFHLGHKYLIERALEHADKIIIGIGSPNISDEKNPYDLETRQKFLLEYIKNAKIENKVIKIVPIADVPDDEEWYKLANAATGPVDIVVGDNDWVNDIYASHGVSVQKIGHHKREILEGTKIRHQIKTKRAWKTRVPKYLVPHIDKSRD